MVCMTSALGAARHVIQEEDPRDVEGDVLPPLDRRDVPLQRMDHGQVDENAVVNAAHVAGLEPRNSS